MGESPRIHIGNQTAFFVGPLLPFEFAVEQGFDAFEFFPDGEPAGPGWSAADLSLETRARIRTTAEAHDLRLSVHASLCADLLSAAGRNVLWADVDLARDIRARVFNIHLLPVWDDAYVGAVLSLATRLAAADLVLAIENTPANRPEDFDALFVRLRALDAAAARPIGICLDIGHANLHDGTRNDYLAYFDRLATSVPVVHVHAHENRGDADSHMTLFTGPARKNPAGIEGLVRRLLERHYAGSVILEQWPDPPELLASARRKLRAMIAADH
jgi:sugar phosphate isomerase/epimerase